MIKSEKKKSLAVLVTALVILAYIPNLLWWVFELPMLPFFAYQSNIIYIGLLVAWSLPTYMTGFKPWLKSPLTA